MNLQDLLSEYEAMRPLLSTGAVIILTFIAIILLRRVFEALEPKIPLPIIATMMIRRILRYGIYVLAVCVILNIWGVEMNAILATIGGLLAMVAIGFVAVWSLLSNILCAFVLTAFRPFRIGDDIELIPDNVKGKVVDLTLLYTSLRAEEGDLYQVPNNMFFQKIFLRREGSKQMDLGAQLLKTKPAEL